MVHPKQTQFEEVTHHEYTSFSFFIWCGHGHETNLVGGLRC